MLTGKGRPCTEIRLYEQERRLPTGFSPLEMYVKRWFQRTRSGAIDLWLSDMGWAGSRLFRVPLLSRAHSVALIQVAGRCGPTGRRYLARLNWLPSSWPPLGYLILWFGGVASAVGLANFKIVVAVLACLFVRTSLRAY